MGQNSEVVARLPARGEGSEEIEAESKMEVTEEEDTFITPDRIQESFDQIEKFIVAEDDNIFVDPGL